MASELSCLTSVRNTDRLFSLRCLTSVFIIEKFFLFTFVDVVVVLGLEFFHFIILICDISAQLEFQKKI